MPAPLYEGSPEHMKALRVFVSNCNKRDEEMEEEEKAWKVIPLRFPAELNTVDEAENSILATQLEEFLVKLPERWRDVLEAHVVDGETFEEIGARFGVTRQTTFRNMQDAVKRLLETPQFSPLREFLER